MIRATKCLDSNERVSDIYTLLSVLFWLKGYLYIIVSAILAEILPKYRW